MLSDTETGIQGSDWVRDDEVDEPTLHKPHATVSLPGSIVLLCACVRLHSCSIVLQIKIITSSNINKKIRSIHNREARHDKAL